MGKRDPARLVMLVVLAFASLGGRFAGDAVAQGAPAAARCTDCGPQNIKPRKRVKLTADERETLARGEISVGARIYGPVLAATIGLGFGQAAQGRWDSAGKFYLIAEPGAVLASFLVLALAGCGSGHVCEKSNLYTMFLVVRGISLLDTIVVPIGHNADLRRIRGKLRRPPAPRALLSPFVLPAERGSGATAGLLLRF